MITAHKIGDTLSSCSMNSGTRQVTTDRWKKTVWPMQMLSAKAARRHPWVSILTQGKQSRDSAIGCLAETRNETQQNQSRVCPHFTSLSLIPSPHLWDQPAQQCTSSSLTTLTTPLQAFSPGSIQASQEFLLAPATPVVQARASKQNSGTFIDVCS